MQQDQKFPIKELANTADTRLAAADRQKIQAHQRAGKGGCFIGLETCSLVERQLSTEEILNMRSQTEQQVMTFVGIDSISPPRLTLDSANERQVSDGIARLPNNFLEVDVDDLDQEALEVRRSGRKGGSIRRNINGSLLTAKTGDEVFLDRDVIRQDVKLKAVRAVPGGGFIPAKPILNPP